MKTFTNCAEKKAKQFLNLLQGYTKGIRMTAILVLLLMGVSNAWASNEYNKRYLYFDGSAFTAFFSDNCKPYISPKWDYNGNDGNSNGGDKQMTQISSSHYYYLDLSKSSASYASFRGFYIGRSASFYNGAHMGYPNGSSNNCIKATGWGTYSWSKYAPPMESASITNTSTVYGGDGTQGNPYQIKKGTKISVSATATSTIPNDPQTIYYNFYKKENNGSRTSVGSESTTTTSSFTASSTVGTKYAVDVEARNEYYGTYGEKATSSTLYFITIEPIYAILGSFNAWTHSANTWDLSDQGSNIWKATFHLDKGSHTFKVVHNSSYYGKNSTTITRSSATASSLSTSGADINLTADYAGNYTFTFNSSTKNLTVTYPTIYKVTYSQTPAAAASAPTTSPSVLSGNSVVSGTSLTFTAQTAKTGYTWKGWYSNNAGTGDALTTNLAYTKSITANTTIYAVYTAYTYTVKFDANGGTGSMSNQNFTYGTSQNLTANTFTRTGYTFAGWATSANGNKVYNDKQSVSNLSTTNGAIVTLYAKWTATNYTVTYNTNGGNSIAQKTYTIETATFDLPTPTRTGYTFAGWYDNENLTGNKVTQVAKGSTGNKTFYAAWTINQYTLTYSAGEGGTVSGTYASGSKLNYNTSVTLTADPADGNIFTQWVNQNDELVSAANPYTFTLQESKTLKAQFTQATIVYLKPEDYWKSDNACFGIYAKKGSTEQKIEMESIDCENAYYSATVPVGYSEFKYVRLNPNNKNQVWNETPYFSASNAKGKYYVTPRIYFKPSGNWKLDNARFAAYFFNSTNNSENTWRDLKKTENDLYTCNIPGGYDMVIFCRMNPATNENSFNDGVKWNQTGDLSINPEHNNKGNCFEMTGKEWEVSGSWSTYWETSTTYTVTLKSSSYGLYNVSINGQTHHSNYKTDVVVENVPLGAQVEVYNIMPHNPKVYNEDIIVKRSSNASYERYTNNKTFTVCGNTTIAEDFVTKEAHTLYLGVPDALITATTQWNLQKFIWTKNGSGDQPLIESTQSFKIGTVTYYEITIPAGYNKFCFQSKQQAGSGPTECQSIWFYRSIPTNNVNCFTLKNEKDGSGYYKGDWSQLPAAEGDFRVLYIEQQVAHGTGADDWKTVIDTTYQHSSDIIKKGAGATIVSLHIKYDKTKHPEVILQKFTSGKWVDVEGQAHMVLGPLTASADMAMLPGRRNTEGDANLRYGDGIEEIKADAANGKAGRVWNFVVQQSGNSAYINFNANDFALYTGDYYIRTDNAEGGWVCYNHPRNVMSNSEYSLKHSGYSHYFCKWVDKKDQIDPEDKIYTPNVKFVVANDYGAVISDTIASDIYTDKNGTLEADANVRWMWNEYTNIGSRAYIAGSSVSNFLVAKYVSTESQDKTGNFKDMGDWVYEADLKNVQIDDKLTSITATYDEKPQELLEQKFIDENGGLVMLTSTGGARTTYTVRVIYDFKINKTIVYLIPTTQAVTTSIDVIIERINQDEAGEATQVTAAITPADKEKGLTVYGVITLTKDHITDSEKSEQETLTYWISFPFDVKIGDITGFGEVGKHWMIKYYDGAERAAKGWFLDTKTFWKFFLDTEDVMEANTGYVLTLNKSLLNESNPVYDNTETLRLYFPSMNKIKDDITSGWTETSVTLDPLECTITSPADRREKDSHWNLIGVPSYAHKTNNKSVKFFYDYDFHEDKYSAEKNAGPNTFYAMHAYMVQYHGTINWSTFTTTPAQLAAKKNTDAEEQYTLRLELQQNGTKADQTFVELHDDASTMFDMNVDLTKMFNASSANIYTLIGSDNQVAANVMPIANTVIPVGVQIAKAGEYTFAMPDGTDGITVELIDYETNIRTNLMLDEYTVDLAAGTNEARFALHVKPSKVTTSIDPVLGENGQVRKILMNGQLYLLKDGQLYDAQGRCVQ